VMPEPGDELLPPARQLAPEPATLRFGKRVAALALERFPHESTLDPDGQVRVSLPGATLDWVVSLALTHAGDVEVLGPPALIERVRDAAWRQLQRYRT